MSIQNIEDKIIADAKAEAEKILLGFSDASAKLKAESQAKIDLADSEARTLVEARSKVISDGLLSSARLDGAKIMLAAKRAIIDEVYSLALKKMCQMDKVDTLSLATKLIDEYGEEGDSIVFCEGFPYVADVCGLEICNQKGIVYGGTSKKVQSGFMLCGKVCDKDLSYTSLLAQDRATHEMEVASSLFKS